MKIPSDLQIPAMVFAVQAGMLAALALIFLVMRP
jgi:hypothetical protein